MFWTIIEKYTQTLRKFLAPSTNYGYNNVWYLLRLLIGVVRAPIIKFKKKIKNSISPYYDETHFYTAKSYVLNGY